jgi:hypothetical protein
MLAVTDGLTERVDTRFKDGPILLESVLSRRLILVTGKGGTGKSITSLALALAGAKAGRNVLLIENHYAGRLTALTDRCAYPSNLTIKNITFAQTFRDFINQEFSSSAVAKKLFQADFLRKFLHTIPGFNELLFLGELIQFLKRDRYNLVIWDGFASGHFLSLVKTPQGIIDSGVGGRIAQEAEKIIAALRDPSDTALVVTGLLQPLVMSETMEFWTKFWQLFSPAQSFLALRVPLWAYCAIQHEPKMQKWIDEIRRLSQQAWERYTFPQGKDAPPVLWSEDLGGIDANPALNLHEFMFPRGGA